jgi:hypothetical protein
MNYFTPVTTIELIKVQEKQITIFCTWFTTGFIDETRDTED